MVKRLFAIFLTTLLLCGCQLAEPEPETVGPDRLVGVFVTREHLNLFDMEAYLQDNAGKILNGGELLAEDSAEYSQRISAELVPEEWTDEEGNVHTTWQYQFPDLEGQLLSCYLVEKDGERYWSSSAGEWFSEIHTGIVSNEFENTGIDLRSTIYVSEEMDEILFFYNPVYQTAGGELYLLEGQGSGCQYHEGSAMTHTLNEERESTVPGDGNTYRTDIEIVVECVAIPQGIILIYMDENNEVIGRQEYPGEEIPVELSVPEGTEYLICETYCRGGEGEQTMFRQIHDRESDPIELYRNVEDGICTKTELRVTWPEETTK